MSKTDGYKDGGITHFLAEGRRVQHGKGSYTVTIPKALAMEWGLEDGDELLFTAQEGSTEATIHEPGSEGGFSVRADDD
ncbi:AbrB/MazE/SpoVT family DNA-binding domain-containing protein [Halorubrum sp. BOL3-1]|uniref:AbrB/MazE/SpoVT family DNA-binding domain-containing protein n=1 Tax=Halorubrum sp. BOL3-1 TaxID=2497325 RepID=UPI00100506ED|nr:AbrB/MazE/SpoVT family DNA-binding domain-containing protein [Halorubrum sp. BOL3-1]QAU11446.1 AbrB/MazE/SpoVT family DNA-binding domain-containing protein [Halorubrum sp. BOL3-1]